ncbi:SPFH domain-containing protein [Nevskia sp.]|uniref:SPFH domain-containing protein n=1 Tax=Nevskia sp. TaxID=1929292 RepID=UPI0025FEEFDD|nr:SPFH domain-containing protein [Nevskia sp.]
MALLDFIKKQFIDVIEWTEDGDDVLAWRFPMADNEIQTGAQLTVRESQFAVFVNEGVVVDAFGPGRHRLSTQTLPLLTNLKNWDKLFDSPFKSDVYFFSARQRLDQRWGTAQPVTLRDKEFGAVRVRAHGNYSFQIADPKLFHTQISGTRDRYLASELSGQLFGVITQHLASGVAESGIAFLDLAANQTVFAGVVAKSVEPAFSALGLKVTGLTVQSLSLPEELQKILDQRIGMGMVGNDMGKFIQYQTGQAIPDLAKGGGSGGGVAGDAAGLGAGLALGQMLAQNIGAGLAGASSSAAAAIGVKPDEVMALLEKLHELKTKGILSDAEFDAKKAELLKKLV